MRFPIRKQRLIAIPLLIIGVALMLVQFDVMLAERLDPAFVVAAIYVAVELLMFRAKIWRSK